ncbi:hypothetical protein [Bradyrhizobium sp. USDA 4508]
MTDHKRDESLEAAAINQKVAETFAGKRYAFLSVAGDESWQLAVAVQDEPGYNPIEGKTFEDRSEAIEWAIGLNKLLGLSADDAMKITASTMRKPAASATVIPLRKFVERCARRAETVFKKRGQLLAMYHAIDGAGNELIFPAPPGSKDQSVAKARELLKACEATRVAYLDEAWMMTDQSGLDLAKIEREGVSKQPGRIEIVMIGAEDQAEGMLTAHCEIIRSGNKAVLGKLQIDSKFDSAEGRMVGLLPAPAMKH